jgi:septation ring formation regulator EzrA
MAIERAAIGERVVVVEASLNTLTTAIQGVRDAVTSLETRMNQRFDEVDRRFCEVDRRFSEVDKKFSEIDRRFSDVDRRFNEVDQRFAQVDRRFGGVERVFMWVVGMQIATLLAFIGAATGVITKFL